LARCRKCGRNATQIWDICSLGNKEMHVCDSCDIELNRMVLKFFGYKSVDKIIKRYKKDKFK